MAHMAEQQTPEATERPATSTRGGWLIQALSSLSGALIVGLLALLLNRPDPAPITIHLPPTPGPTEVPTATATPAPLVVHVSGAVRAPGLVTVPAGARVADALELAGGFAPDAAVDAINQAERLWDGVQIHVPRLHDESVVIPPAGVSGGNPPAASGPEVGSASANLIDINTASEADLISLPGIGPARAQAIIAHRPYVSIEDLDRVPNIGPQTIADLRDRIIVR